MRIGRNRGFDPDEESLSDYMADMRKRRGESVKEDEPIPKRRSRKKLSVVTSGGEVSKGKTTEKVKVKKLTGSDKAGQKSDVRRVSASPVVETEAVKPKQAAAKTESAEIKKSNEESTAGVKIEVIGNASDEKETKLDEKVEKKPAVNEKETAKKSVEKARKTASKKQEKTQSDKIESDGSASKGQSFVKEKASIASEQESKAETVEKASVKNEEAVSDKSKKAAADDSQPVSEKKNLSDKIKEKIASVKAGRGKDSKNSKIGSEAERESAPKAQDKPVENKAKTDKGNVNVTVEVLSEADSKESEIAEKKVVEAEPSSINTERNVEKSEASEVNERAESKNDEAKEAKADKENVSKKRKKTVSKEKVEPDFEQDKSTVVNSVAEKAEPEKPQVKKQEKADSKRTVSSKRLMEEKAIRASLFEGDKLYPYRLLKLSVNGRSFYNRIKNLFMSHKNCKCMMMKECELLDYGEICFMLDVENGFLRLFVGKNDEISAPKGWKKAQDVTVLPFTSFLKLRTGGDADKACDFISDCLDKLEIDSIRSYEELDYIEKLKLDGVGEFLSY